MATLQSRPAPRLPLAPLPRHALDLGIEALIAQGLALIQREPYVTEGLVIEMGSEQTAVSPSACLVGCAQCKVDRVRDQQR